MFLAVMLDNYSRRVIGWALNRTMEDEMTLAALRMALARRAVQAGPSIVRSRIAICSNDYNNLLKANSKADPWDNAACES